MSVSQVALRSKNTFINLLGKIKQISKASLSQSRRKPGGSETNLANQNLSIGKVYDMNCEISRIVLEALSFVGLLHRKSHI